MTGHSTLKRRKRLEIFKIETSVALLSTGYYVIQKYNDNDSMMFVQGARITNHVLILMHLCTFVAIIRAPNPVLLEAVALNAVLS